MKLIDYETARLISRKSQKVVIKELNNLSLAPEQEIGYEFIRLLFMEFAKESIRFGNNRYDFLMYPHFFRERQLSSVITPILYRLCKGFVLAELPVHRNDSDNTCWADYWCIYKNYTFIIEMKHSRDILDTDSIREDSIVGRWKQMKKQLSSVKNEIRLFEEKTEGVIRIGLHFISSKSNKELDQSNIKSYQSKTKERLIRFGKKLKPDYAGCWLVPEKTVNFEGLAYPGVLLMGKIYSPIPHK